MNKPHRTLANPSAWSNYSRVIHNFRKVRVSDHNSYDYAWQCTNCQDTAEPGETIYTIKHKPNCAWIGLRRMNDLR